MKTRPPWPKKTRQLEDISKIDALTGIYNRRHFNQILDLEWKRGSREKRLLTMIMLDIDHFKHINDTYGHLAGDDYLKSVAAILKVSFKTLHRCHCPLWRRRICHSVTGHTNSGCDCPGGASAKSD